MPKNHYLTLGVPSDASPAEIKAAFRRRALELHPDLSGKGSGPFLEVLEAYETLNDAQRRHHYDGQTHRQQRAPRRRPEAEPMIHTPPAEPFASGRVCHPGSRVMFATPMSERFLSIEEWLDFLLSDF